MRPARVEQTDQRLLLLVLPAHPEPGPADRRADHPPIAARQLLERRVVTRPPGRVDRRHIPPIAPLEPNPVRDVELSDDERQTCAVARVTLAVRPASPPEAR
jgi:hypothetical protein